MFFFFLPVAAVIGSAIAQRPANTSICDYYTTALLATNSAANQKTLVTVVVNTALAGNYTQPNVGISVPGILASGQYNGSTINLADYFNGNLASSNRGGSSGTSVNYLDDGGATPLLKSMPANGSNSNQYTLLTHLYEYFGALLGCSLQGSSDYPAYAGDNGMYEVHKFMAISANEIGYFITQVALSMSSFGVASGDLEVVGQALNAVFGYRCSPETVVVNGQPAALQAICIDDTCPVATTGSTCGAYSPVVKPVAAASASAGNSASTNTSPTTNTKQTTSTSTSTSTSTNTNSNTNQNTTTSPSPSYTNTPNNSLSTGAKAGIGVGAAVAVFLLLGLLFFLIRHRRQNTQIPKAHNRDGVAEMAGNPINELGSDGGKARAKPGPEGEFRPELEAQSKGTEHGTSPAVAGKGELAELHAMPNELE